MIDWESPRAKKWLIENEPILLRDILPKVMVDIRQRQRCRAKADHAEMAKHFELIFSKVPVFRVSTEKNFLSFAQDGRTRPEQ
ncbi:unnamed protein product [marine sediment metagenome]|uniref:Uncharacterized protein n=1 Tax=marine sediment metagenome TaxID=412755 RepID=X1QJ39_9ZZZZ